MTIETIHRCRIDFTVDRNNASKEVDIIHQMAHRIHKFKKDGIELLEVNEGGPCWHAYLVFEGKNLAQIEAFESKILRYIALRKGEVLL